MSCVVDSANILIVLVVVCGVSFSFGIWAGYMGAKQ